MFHKYFHDIIFSEIDNRKDKITVLEEVVRFRKAWELQELIDVDHRIVKDFSGFVVCNAIENVHNVQDQKNGY